MQTYLVVLYPVKNARGNALGECLCPLGQDLRRNLRCTIWTLNRYLPSQLCHPPLPLLLLRLLLELVGFVVFMTVGIVILLRYCASEGDRGAKSHRPVQMRRCWSHRL